MSRRLPEADRLTTQLRYWRKLGEEVRIKRRLLKTPQS